MAVTYLAFHFNVEPRFPGSEILMAELGELPFDSFEETETGISAYIPKDEYKDGMISTLEIINSPEFQISYTQEEIDPVNWNSEWEKNFDPIDVDNRCYVRAPFHPERGAEYEIVIEPKMSFGTGHHETTHMMIQHLLETDLSGKKTLDMGSGTAILAILAEMRGAQPVDAIDIDPWCFENAAENTQRNNCQHITVELGDAALLKGRRYDVIIANINRNILLEDMPAYVACLNPGGSLYLSGFYMQDIAAIDERCLELGLKPISEKNRNNWASLRYDANQ